MIEHTKGRKNGKGKSEESLQRWTIDGECHFQTLSFLQNLLAQKLNWTTYNIKCTVSPAIQSS